MGGAEGKRRLLFCYGEAAGTEGKPSGPVTAVCHPFASSLEIVNVEPSAGGMVDAMRGRGGVC